MWKSLLTDDIILLRLKSDYYKVERQFQNVQFRSLRLSVQDQGRRPNFKSGLTTGIHVVFRG